MRIKKKIILLILFFVLITTFISSFNVVLATQGQMILNIKKERSSGYGYMLGNSNKYIWKIYEKDNDRNQTIYCLKGGPGFGSNNMFNATPQDATYTNYFDMRQPETITDTFKKYSEGDGEVKILPEAESNEYKAIMWILDNCFILPEKNSEQASSSDITIGDLRRDNLLKSAKAYAKETGEDVRDGDFDCLTDDDIDVVQQLAIWHYTNSGDDYHVGETFELWLNQSKNDVSQPNTYKPLSERNCFENGEKRAKACQALFDYLVETPQNMNYNYDYKNVNTNTKPVTFDETNVTMEVSNNRYIFGPYKLENSEDKIYNLEATVTSGENANQVNDVKYLNSEKVEVDGTTLDELVGKNFYISVPNTTDYSKIKVEISGTYYTTKITYWSVDNPNNDDQPVVKVEKEKKTFTDSKEFTPGEFDLALRKFIVSINGVDVKNEDGKFTREPQISQEEIENLTTKSATLNDGTTAEKTHPKDALTVKTGDIVKYKIRIYNEGEIAGYATEVTDYLPNGLAFIQPGTEEGQSEVNQDFKWTVENDGRTVKTKYLENERIEAFKSNANSLPYQDLEIECKVVAIPGNIEKELTNIAEITAHKDEYGITDKDRDRDSKPNNVNKDEYNNQSQEDDDDFERLKLAKANGSYEIEIEKVDPFDTSKKLKGAGFSIEINGVPLPTNTPYVTNDTGKISVKNIPISEAGTQTITITETKAPTGYSNQKIKITIIVTTELEGEVYVVKDIKSSMGTNQEDSKYYKATLEENKIIVQIKNYKLDLALRKFITKVDDTDITNRVPVFTKLSETEFKYEHTKDPVQVANGNIVTYTLRIFNEGNVAGYASKIKDDLPEGLTFLPDNATNVEYRWKMYTEEGVETDNVEEAKYIETDYLAKENEKEENANLLKAFDQETMTMPDYRDVKIAFKVSEPNTSDRIIINTAEITDDRDENNEPVDDIDSTPDNDEPDEDDIDEEKIKVQYFDLSLKKWVSESIVTYGGKTTVTKTGHTGDENPEPPAKVEIRGSRIDKTTVKFKFVIKVTNEGEIAGYAKELIDYIPEGLKFDAKDNPLWREEDGKVLTDQLKDTLLQPGESAQVEIILTWINNKNNLGEKVNWAEIYKDDNEPHSPDIDSEPGNNKPEEDDIDDAPVILGVVTGSVPTYVGLVIIAVSILAGGVVLIKKFVI